MVYLVRDGRAPRAAGVPNTTWADRPYLYGCVLDCTAADIRVLARYCVSLGTVEIGGAPWWYGWCLAVHAAELLAAGRVRDVPGRWLSACTDGLVAGDDLVIR